MPFPTIAASNGGNEATATSVHTCNLPTGIGADDLLILALCCDQAPTYTWPTGWTDLGGDQRGAAVRMEMRYRIADGTEGSTITIGTSTNEKSGHQSYRIDDVAFSGTAPEAAITNGGSTTPDSPSLSPSWGADDTLWLAINGHDDGTNTFTQQPTSYTTIRAEDNSGGNDGAGIIGYERQNNTATEDPGSSTMDAAEQWVAGTIAIQGTAATEAVGGAYYQQYYKTVVTGML